MLKGEAALLDQLNAYTSFQINGVEVPIPYYLSKERFRYWESSGKGSPEVIYVETLKKAQQQGVDLAHASQGEIYKFMQRNRIGVECSGFVYHLLDAYVYAERGTSLSQYLHRFPGIIGAIEKRLLSAKRERRINVRTLTSDINSREVENLQDIQIGDTIRMSGTVPGDHILIIVGLEHNEHDQLTRLTYAHSSGKDTIKRGPHTAQILINDPNQPLKQQEWQEKRTNGTTMDTRFREDWGDQIRRLRIVDQIQKQQTPQ